jgi:cullin-4
MIAKLKAECGATFTNKLEGMFKDMDLSREIMNAYAQHLESKRAGERRDRLEMTVQVLTTGYWPAYPPMDVVVPPVLQEHMQR